MGLLDVILGRSKPKKANLDTLFDVPNAAMTLHVNGWTATGVGSVCYRAAEGVAFAEAQASVAELLNADDGPDVELSSDSFGFTWLTVRSDPAAGDFLSGLVTDLHAVNATLADNGFDTMLLCSLICFTGPDDRSMALVYLYKQGTYYPFIPKPGSAQSRDNMAEIGVKNLIGADLPFEADLGRWLAVWGAPGL
jgi:PspA associated protein B